MSKANFETISHGDAATTNMYHAFKPSRGIQLPEHEVCLDLQGTNPFDM